MKPDTFMQVPLLDLKKQFKKLEKEILPAVKNVLRDANYIMGRQVEELEKKICNYLGCKYAIAVASGTDALLLSLRALDIGPGDEVVTSPYTFFATAGAIVNVGAKPVFADIEDDTYNIDPWKIEKVVTGKTKAIIPVHLFGQCADIDRIKEIADKHKLYIIEDACQSIGAEYKPRTFRRDIKPFWKGLSPSLFPQRATKFSEKVRGENRYAGAMGDTGCFSFYPSKNLACFGDGGIVVTNNARLADSLRKLRVHGAGEKYFHKLIGTNSRLDTIQAAVLLIKIKYLEKWISQRQKHAEIYNNKLSGIRDLDLPVVKGYSTHVYNQYAIRTSKRDELQKYLKDNGIGTAIYYPLPLHLQECFRYLGYKKGDFPIAEKASRETLSIPIFPELTREEQNYIIDKIKRF